MNATFKQAGHLIQLAIAQELSNEGFQTLTNLGLLSDLFRAAREGNLGTINREVFRKLIGLDQSFLVKLGGPETTDEIVASLGFPADPLITQENYPLKVHRDQEVEIKIIDPDCNFSEEKGSSFLVAADLERPTYEHALRFAQQYGKATTSTEKPYIIFLHEACRDRGTISLLRHPGWRRELRLSNPTFSECCVLAGVRPRNPA